MPNTLFVGAISGTSVDGLDLALVDIDDQHIELHASSTHSFSPELRSRLLALGQPGNDDLDRLGAADRALGLAIGRAINDFLDARSIDAQQVAAIGSHGQTVRHRPTGLQPFTWQIGDPNQIAETTGITCVADFRRRDMAAGGQGAPLVPPFHAALFRDRAHDRVVLNLGGIGNITVLPADSSVAVSGFDTGPGNALMDSWVSRHCNRPFDQNGEWAAEGKPDEALLGALLGDPYLGQAPPKSTGREHYNLAWLDQHPRVGEIAPADVQATLLEFSARSAIDAIGRWADACDELLVCGGGRLNQTLMGRLAALAHCPVAATEDYGVNGDAIEAAAFAWLAAQTLRGNPGNAPAVTGARGPRVLGAIYPA